MYDRTAPLHDRISHVFDRTSLRDWICLTEPPKNVKNKIFYPKHLVLIGILKNPRDKIREFIFKKLCQEDFVMGPLFKVDFGKKNF